MLFLFRKYTFHWRVQPWWHRSKNGLVVSELASHCYDPGLIPGSSITCKLSLLLRSHPCTHSFSLGPPSTKTIIPNSHSPWKHGLRGKSGKSLNWFYWQTWELVSMKFASNFIWQKHVLLWSKVKVQKCLEEISQNSWLICNWWTV